MSCTTIAAGKNITETGLVLVAHNEDEGGRFVVYHGTLPEMNWDLNDPEQAFLPAEEGLAAIPQVPHSFGAYWVENVNPERGASNSDMFYNQNGVLVTSNAAQASKPDPEDPALVKDGGIAYNLRRAIAERAESARHGVQIAVSLLAEWGYAPSGRNYTIADKNEAWNLQAVRGHYYAAVRIPDNAVMVLPNHLSIHTLTEFPVSLALDPVHPHVPMDADFSEGACLYPADLISNAIENGWYTPQDPERIDDFDYAWVYQAASSWKGLYNTNRHARGMQIILNQASLECPADPLAEVHRDPNTNYYPFCVYPSEPVRVTQLAEILCSHFETFPEIREELGPGKSPHIRRGFILCYGGSTESFIARFTANPEDTTFYTAFGRTCHQPYVALHPLHGAADALEPMADPVRTMREHLLHQPERTCWRDNAWWQGFRRFQELADMQFCDLEEPLHELREAHLRREIAANEQALAEHVDLRAFDNERVAIALSEWKAFERDYFNIAEVLPHPAVYLDDSRPVFELSFRLPDGQAPLEESLILIQSMLHLEKESAKVIPGSLKQTEDGVWHAAFESEKITSKSYGTAGIFDYYLGGKNTAGKTFAGQLLLEFI